MRWLLILFVSLPVWVVLYLALAGSWGNLTDLKLVDSTVFTFKQSILSAIVSMLLGTVGAFGLLGFQATKRKISEGVCLLPTVFPSLFLILASLNFIEVFTEFPYGLWGIVIVHSFINIGLASVLIAKTVEQKIGMPLVWAWLSGVPKPSLLYHGVLKALKWDFSRIFFVIFLFSWCSFTIPYLVGTLNETTLEVLLFEQIKIHLNWQKASVVAVFQLAIIWGVGILFLKKDILSPSKLERPLDFISAKLGVLIPVSVVGVLLFGSFTSLQAGIGKLIDDTALQSVVFESSVVSLSLGLATAIITAVFSFMILWCWSTLIRRFFILYQSPSALILGFIFVYLFGNSHFTIFITAFCIAFLYLPFLYKLSLDSKFLSLEPYQTTAKLLGANKYLTFNEVSLPLALPAISLASAIAGFWAAGDYAVSALFLTSDPSLPIVIERLISTYRFELATVLTWINLIVGVFVFLIPLGVGYVYSQKYKS
ncbi:MAG: hypothetical protein MK008_10690 [Bdellovibrionales bacterium]|nr:hypothetical protein [Bdellovibrionales bacterium]